VPRIGHVPARSLFLCGAAPRALQFDPFKVRPRCTFLNPHRNTAELSLGTYRKSRRMIRTFVSELKFRRNFPIGREETSTLGYLPGVRQVLRKW